MSKTKQMSKTKKEHSFNMEKDGSIIKSNDYILSVVLTNQYDPTAIERAEPYTKSARLKSFKQMKKLKPWIKTNFESFSSYVNVIPTLKTKGRWDKYISNGEVNEVRNMLIK